MGPFPHEDTAQEISKHNPAGTDGFEFIEYAHPQPEKLGALFEQMGFRKVAKHRSKNITLYRQGDVNYIINAEPGSFAAGFAKIHGPSACSICLRVVDADHALKHATSRGATAITPVGDQPAWGLPGIEGIGGSRIYFTDRHRDNGTPYDDAFDLLEEFSVDEEIGKLFYIDHLTNNVRRGNMDVWAEFYERIFNFKQIRYFDIEGKLTGLLSRAMCSPCGKIRIPVNEGIDEGNQIEEFLKDYNGEGIQHVACGTHDIYHTVATLKQRGLKFMPSPPDAYYDMASARVLGHEENIDRLKESGVLIDGEGVVDGGETKVLLQIFSQTVIGPIFFEFIQRKGDDGFGEGNFRALFESIEEDQIRRGVLEVG